MNVILQKYYTRVGKSFINLLIEIFREISMINEKICQLNRRNRIDQTEEK